MFQTHTVSGLASNITPNQTAPTNYVGGVKLVDLQLMHHKISLTVVYFLHLAMFYSRVLRLVRMDLLHGFFLTTSHRLQITRLITSNLMVLMLLRSPSETSTVVLLFLTLILESLLVLRLESRTSIMILD
ncbi:MAG: hypothetical protein CM15mV3_2820 [Caudoviricetes sp.]|nr:MAG: hypothetical protein CM15mV3_2820 [Caudoviricetes sp.]